MRNTAYIPSFALALALSACASEPAPSAAPEPKGTAAPMAEAPAPKEAPKAATAAAVKPLDKKQFGAAISEQKTTALPDILKDPKKFAGQTVRTEGIVSAVCKSAGCWMEISDETGTAHIKMAGHSFFIPREASGHRAAIQGKLLSSAEEASAACPGKGECCGDSDKKEAGHLARVELEATGVQFLD